MTTDRIPAVLRPAILRFARTPGRHAARVPTEPDVIRPEPPPVVQRPVQLQPAAAPGRGLEVSAEAPPRQPEIYCWS